MKLPVAVVSATLVAGIVPVGALMIHRAGAAALPAEVNAETAAGGRDPRIVALLKRMETAARNARTLTANFTYTVNSVKKQQYIAGKMILAKPNKARVTFSYMADPHFPNLIASDGKTVYSFTPQSFNAKRRFVPGPFDPVRGARQASGLLPGGGKIGTDPADPKGVNVRLWDGVPLSAFFSPSQTIRNYIYTSDPATLRYEGEQNINGVTYRVLQQYLKNGNIPDGEITDFEQRLYVGPDDLIHQYVLEFTSKGRPGVQVMRLKNIRVNVPVSARTFAFTPPRTR